MEKESDREREMHMWKQSRVRRGKEKGRKEAASELEGGMERRRQQKRGRVRVFRALRHAI